MLSIIKHWLGILLINIQYIPAEEEDVPEESPGVLVGVVTGATSTVEC